MSSVPLAIEDISPDIATAGTAVAVSISGRGFLEGATVKIGAVALTDVAVTGASLISATVPGALEPGSYSVIVVNPDGVSAFLADAFEVRAAVTPKSDDGCSGGNMAGLGLALLVLGVRAASVLRRESVHFRERRAGARM